MKPNCSFFYFLLKFMFILNKYNISKYYFDFVDYVVKYNCF